MSGIFGLFNLDGAAVTTTELTQMASLLQRRGPDRTRLWHKGSVGMGHKLLATTPEAVHEHQPVTNAESKCTITADARLDNRKELLNILRLENHSANIGDAEIILHSYLLWGQDCVEHFLGDFAFAIYDSKRKMLFCARDQFGVRPFYYHHMAGHFFAYASEPRAILTLEKIPYVINDNRIADFLITQLEGIDKTSTFYQNIYRLPPAHTLTVTPNNMKLRCYWELEPVQELELSSNDEYAEAFLEVFTESVNCRLRSASPVGSMLSGGMDSASVVAVAKELLAKKGKGPLSTFSAVGPDSDISVESHTIHAAITMSGLDPHTIYYDQLDDLIEKLGELSWNLDEPFDNHMTLLRAVYLLAQQQGINVIMDGIDGDSVLAEGTHIARLLRRGHFLTAYREAVGHDLFWRGAYPAWRQLYLGARSAYCPDIIRRLYHHFSETGHNRQALERLIRHSFINRDFAQHIKLGKRLQTLNSYREASLKETYINEAKQFLEHPYLTVGIERYNRVASSLAIEPRHPWLDRRLVSFCMTLPGNQKLRNGWPKAILRKAMAEKLPDTVRWRQGKEHLGWAFTKVLMENYHPYLRDEIESNWDLILPYIDENNTKDSCGKFFKNQDFERSNEIYDLAQLAMWLRKNKMRPRVRNMLDLESRKGVSNYTDD